MRQVVCREFAPLDRLSVEEAPDPRPGPGHVLIRTRAAAVSFVDGLVVRGLYQVKPALPFVPGTAVSGEVIAVGPGVEHPKVGARVLAASGGYASVVAADATTCVELPETVPHEIGASMVESYATMLFAFTRRTTIEPGQWVVVLGAGGGIGLAAVDIARSLGARVIAAASSAEKLAMAVQAGAEATIDYGTEDLKQRIREITDGGADVVVDPVGGPYTQPALRALSEFGRYLVVGFAAGEIPQLPANRVLIGNRTVIGVDLGDYLRPRPAERAALLAELVERVASDRLRPVKSTTYPLDKASQALLDIAHRRVAGKLVLIP